jgi:hypothetical protein
MGIHLQQCPVVSPALLPAWGDRHDVPGEALHPALEVVAANERRVLALSLHYEEAPKQPHRCRTPTNISQKWMRIATSMMELGERCCSWSP